MQQFELVELYKSLNPNSNFFDKETMEFWDSRIVKISEPTSDGSVFFLTSERDGTDDNLLFYSVRFLENKPGVDVDTISFQKHSADELEGASAALREARTAYQRKLNGTQNEQA